MRYGMLSVLVLTLLALPLASAQVPSTSPTSTLTITGLPAQVQGLESNKTVEVPFSVEYRVNGNFLCPQATVVPVTISLQQGGQSSFITATAEPAAGEITLAQGPHQNAAGKVDGKIVVTLTEVNANASIPLTISAEAGAAQCQPMIPAATAEPATTYANVTYTPPPTPTPPPENDSPGPGALMGILAATVAAVVFRRRRA